MTSIYLVQAISALLDACGGAAQPKPTRGRCTHSSPHGRIQSTTSAVRVEAACPSHRLCRRCADAHWASSTIRRLVAWSCCARWGGWRQLSRDRPTRALAQKGNVGKFALQGARCKPVTPPRRQEPLHGCSGGHPCVPRQQEGHPLTSVPLAGQNDRSNDVPVDPSSALAVWAVRSES